MAVVFKNYFEEFNLYTYINFELPSTFLTVRLRRPVDVISGRPQDVRLGRPRDVRLGRPCDGQIGSLGDVLGTLEGEVLETSWGPIFSSWVETVFIWFFNYG